MVITIRKRVLLCALSVLLVLTAVALLLWRRETDSGLMGGVIHAFRHSDEELQPVSAMSTDSAFSRFERPSRREPLANPYTFSDFENQPTPKFSQSREVVLAYWGLLRNASNMLRFSGGCGTIGDATLPYPLAYQLLTPDARSSMSLDDFVDSFAGYGRILLLQLHQASAPPGTSPNTAYYMVELESVAGRPYTDDVSLREPGGSLFAYHYGLIAVKNLPGAGWKIDALDFIPEDFLCAPYHGWSYDAESVVEIVFKSNLGLITRVDKTEISDTLVTVTASGNGLRYKFAFVRLTNGCDILLRQYAYRDGTWTEENLLPPDWDYLLFAPGYLD